MWFCRLFLVLYILKQISQTWPELDCKCRLWTWSFRMYFLLHTFPHTRHCHDSPSSDGIDSISASTSASKRWFKLKKLTKHQNIVQQCSYEQHTCGILNLVCFCMCCHSIHTECLCHQYVFQHVASTCFSWSNFSSKLGTAKHTGFYHPELWSSFLRSMSQGHLKHMRKLSFIQSASQMNEQHCH